MPSPVFTGDPPRPLFIPGDGDVLVPALADDPCDCCGEPLEGCLKCTQGVQTATFTVNGFVHWPWNQFNGTHVVQRFASLDRFNCPFERNWSFDNGCFVFGGNSMVSWRAQLEIASIDGVNALCRLIFSAASGGCLFGAAGNAYESDIVPCADRQATVYLAPFIGGNVTTTHSGYSGPDSCDCQPLVASPPEAVVAW